MTGSSFSESVRSVLGDTMNLPPEFLGFLPQYIAENPVSTKSPGAELAYAEFTATVNATSSVQTSAVTVVSAPPLSFSAATEIRVEFYCPEWTASDNSAGISLCLFDRSTSGPVGVIMTATGVSGANGPNQPGFTVVRHLTAAAGSHTFFVGIYDAGAVTTTHARVLAGTGGSALAPGYIRITYQ